MKLSIWDRENGKEFIVENDSVDLMITVYSDQANGDRTRQRIIVEKEHIKAFVGIVNSVSKRGN